MIVPLPKMHDSSPNPNLKKSNAILINSREINDILNSNSDLFDSTVKSLRIQEEQEYVSCFQWYGIPEDLSTEFLERMMYYKATLVCFYFEPNKKFYFMPYSNGGDLDFYGRMQLLRPLPFYQASDSEKKLAKEKNIVLPEDLLSNYLLKNINEVVLPGEIENVEKCGVILNDYTPQYSPNSPITPRQILNDPLIIEQASILTYIKTNLLAGTGIRGMRVNNNNAKLEALSASKDIENCAKNSFLYVPIVSSVEFQELTSQSNRAPIEEYLMSYQAIDNLRKTRIGIGNNGFYEKKTQMLENELGTRMTEINTVLKNRLHERQRFCIIANALWGTQMWCDYSEEVINQDINGDGLMIDDKKAENNYYNEIGEHNNDESI